MCISVRRREQRHRNKSRGTEWITLDAYFEMQSFVYSTNA